MKKTNKQALEIVFEQGEASALHILNDDSTISKLDFILCTEEQFKQVIASPDYAKVNSFNALCKLAYNLWREEGNKKFLVTVDLETEYSGCIDGLFLDIVEAPDGTEALRKALRVYDKKDALDWIAGFDSHTTWMIEVTSLEDRVDGRLL